MGAQKLYPNRGNSDHSMLHTLIDKNNLRDFSMIRCLAYAGNGQKLSVGRESTARSLIGEIGLSSPNKFIMDLRDFCVIALCVVVHCGAS